MTVNLIWLGVGIWLLGSGVAGLGHAYVGSWMKVIGGACVILGAIVSGAATFA